MAPKAQTFYEVFTAYVNQLELRALRAGTNLTAVCRDISVSRSTPDRWRRKVPRTIIIVDQMRESVEAAERAQAARTPTANA